MNGKAAKMLRRIRRSDHKSKKHYRSLTHTQRSKVRTAHAKSGNSSIDYLETFFPVKKKNG